MLVDIFSSFDDNNQVFISMYMLMWIFSLRSILLFNRSYWVIKSRWVSLFRTMKVNSASQTFRSFGLKLGGFINIVTALFILLILLNLRGLIPYVYSPTSHLRFSLTLGFPMWLSLILSSIFFRRSSFIASLLPIGAPGFLSPFLVLIETVRISVRPITLSVRLTANIRAGHIVLTLVGNYLITSLLTVNLIRMGILIFVQVFYTIFEICIGLIQGYIFFLLITLYSDEHAY